MSQPLSGTIIVDGLRPINKANFDLMNAARAKTTLLSQKLVTKHLRRMQTNNDHKLVTAQECSVDGLWTEIEASRGI